MKTVIVYYSQHHGNTNKLIDAIAAVDPSVVLIDVTTTRLPTSQSMTGLASRPASISVPLPSRSLPLQMPICRKTRKCSTFILMAHQKVIS